MPLELSVQLGESDDGEAKRRKAWGRGFFEAARAAGIDPEVLMNEAKLARQEQALSGIEAKVFAAIPTEEAWNRHSIITEMRRVTGSQPDPHVVDGCIVDLLSRKLVQEVSVGLFKRVPVKPRVFVMPKQNGTPAPMPEPTEVGPPAPILDVFATLSRDLRALADRFDAAALQVSGELEQHQHEAERFRQLQQLLKGMA